MAPIKHGGSARKHPNYSTWISIRNRCNNPNNKSYFLYGGRGITVCSEWDEFVTFVSDMGLKPSLDYSIERIDNSKGYSKNNCKWATVKEQAQNKRNNIILRYKGIVYRTLVELCEAIGINKQFVYTRLRSGWNLDDAIEYPKNGGGRYVASY